MEVFKMENNFKNTGRLVRMILRRERIVSALWIVLLSAFSVLLAPGLAAMFDASARQALIATIDNPAMIAMLGPIYGVEHYTAGAMYFNMMVQWVMIAAAIMNIMLVVRHTRSDEEHGRTDLIRSLPTGKFASVSAAMIMAFLADLAVALVTGIGIGLCRVEGMGWNGAMLYGAVIGAAGFAFAALTAVFCQLCMTSRGAIGLSVIALGFLYLLRGAGDIGNETLSFISPLGLAQRTKAFVENDWLPILILLAEATVITVIAIALNGCRDIRQGLLPERRGKVKASSWLSSPYGLAFRLLMTPFFGWLIGMFIFGASYGSILGTIDDFVRSSEFYSMIIGANPDYSAAQMFVSMVTSLMALCSVFPVISMVTKFRREENDGYFQNVLSGSVSRDRYLAGYVVIGIVMAVLVQCATALGIYASALVVLPDPGTLPLDYLLEANLVYTPALLVMLGLTVMLIGLCPKATPAVWGYFGFSFMVTFLGRMPDLFPVWVKKTTPFGWIPSLPVEKIHWPTLAVLILLAFALMGVGFAAYRRRDVSA